MLCAGVCAPAASMAGEGQTRAEPTGDGVLLMVERIDGSDSSGFEVDFDRPLQIVSDVSGASTTRFQLRLRPVRYVADPILRNAVTWSPNAELPLKFVEVEKTLSQDLVMNILFSVPVRLKIDVANGMKSLQFYVTSSVEAQRQVQPEPQPLPEPELLPRPEVQSALPGLPAPRVLPAPGFQADLASQTEQVQAEPQPGPQVQSTTQAEPEPEIRSAAQIATEQENQPPQPPEPVVQPQPKPVARVAREKPVSTAADSLAPIDSLSTREMVTESHRAIATGEYDHALAILDLLQEAGAPDQVRYAMEFRGVALERSGRIDLATAQYQRFLEIYPQSPEKARVEHRLAALDGAGNIATAARRTRQQQRKRQDNDGWSTFGSLNNTYRYARNVDDDGGSYDAISLLGVDGDFSGRHRSQAMEWQFRLSGGHYQDMRSDGDNTTDRIRYLSLRGETRDRDYSMLLGRQRSYGAGILSRFDGVTLSGRTSEHTRLNLVAGFPVNTTQQDLMENSRTLYGVNMDFEDIIDALDVTTFFVRQDADGILDRQAVGTELTYSLGRNAFYGMVDYDVHFGALNAAIVNGNHLFESGTRVNWSLNMRKSPYLTATNALIGSGVANIGDLENILTDDEIDDLADDRTRDSKSASLTLSRPLSDRFDLSSSVTWLELSETVASGGVPAYEGSGGQYFLDLRLAGQRLFGDRDLSYVGIRYKTLQTTDIWSFYANSRMPWGSHMSLNPRLRVDYRDNLNGTSQWNMAPGLQLQYQTRRHLIYLESGLIYYRTDYPDLDSRELKTYFTYMGYRVNY